MAKTTRRTTSKKKTKRKARTPKKEKTSGEVESSSQDGKKKRKPPQAFIDHQFKPGQSGNPSGRPKGPQITSLRQKDFMRPAKGVPYAEPLCKELGLDPEKVTLGDVLAAGRCRSHRVVARDSLEDGAFLIEDAVFTERAPAAS